MKSACRFFWLAGLLLACTSQVRAQPRPLEIYWVDVEGGAATLVVSPSGESLLYDSGWEMDGRDAKRIFAVAQQARLKKIDYFVLSHFHADHAGGFLLTPPRSSRWKPIRNAQIAPVHHH